MLSNVPNLTLSGARCSSVVARTLIVRWVDRSIPYGGPTELFIVPASAPKRLNQDRGMHPPVCGMVYINDPLLLIEISSTCYGGSGFPLAISKRSFAICLTPYNRE